MYATLSITNQTLQSCDGGVAEVALRRACSARAHLVSQWTSSCQRAVAPAAGGGAAGQVEESEMQRGVR